MKTALRSALFREFGMCAARSVLLGAMATMGASESARAQGEIGSGTISASGSGPYTYSLSFSDAAGATAPIGSVWYAWYPADYNYLPGVPTSASAPMGWTATVSGNSVQYSADSAAYYITPGHTLSGFGYQAAFSPEQLAAAPNSAISYIYSGGFYSDAGAFFLIQTVPEPSTLSLAICGATAIFLIGRRRNFRSV